MPALEGNFNIDTTCEGLEPWAALTTRSVLRICSSFRGENSRLDFCENCDGQRSCSNTDVFIKNVSVPTSQPLKSPILCLAVFVHAQIH